MTSKYTVGEIVDITIRGARVATRHTDPTGRRIWLELDGDDYALPASAVTVERVAPAEWPPQPGDLWRDREGGVWFAYDAVDYDNDVPADPILMCSTSRFAFGTAEKPADVNRQHGPLALVHRLPAEDGAR